MSKIGEAYSSMLGKLFVINCTSFAKFVYTGLDKMSSEETRQKIKIFTADDVKKGALVEYIDVSVLEQRYSGRRPNIDCNELFAEPQSQSREEISVIEETEYFSVDGDNPLFSEAESSACCSSKECDIY